MSLFDDEKFKNLILFDFYGTDKELEELAPVIVIVAIIAIVVFACIYFFKR